ncbi:DsbA family protein [Minwuia sp.]|uniref:DsbA family protein n=1 Tax=Minwuia sp. TaxID=2493630 RepID=UPI003A8E68D4
MPYLVRTIVLIAMMFGLLQAAIADDARPTAASGLTEPEIRTIVREYLMEHPEIIVEALQIYQQREEMAEAARAREMLLAHRDRLDDPTGKFVAGNPDGDVTIVEFFDYRCGFCKKVMPALLDEVARDGNVRLVLKEFPVLGEDSVRAARAAIAAARQDRYYDMHLAMMQTRGNLTEAKIMSIALDLGLDVDQLKTDMASPEVEDEITRNYELAQLLNIRGTPGFIIGDTMVPGAINAQQFRELIEKARQSKG